MAEPLKALADLVYLNGCDWDSAKPVVESLRELKGEDFEEIEGCYQSGRVRKFLSGLRKDLGR